MYFRIFRAIIPVLLFSLAILTGCRTTTYQPTQDTIEYKISDIQFRLTPLTRDNLIELYGKDENPFIDFPGKLPPRYLLVFDTSITTETSEVEFSRETITISIGESTYKASNYFTLNSNWNSYYDNDTQALHMRNRINKTLKPSEFSASPDAPFKGFLVFLIPIKDATKGTIRIPAKTPQGDEGVIEIPFTLEKYIGKDKAIPSENTGIFAE